MLVKTDEGRGNGIEGLAVDLKPCAPLKQNEQSKAPTEDIKVIQRIVSLAGDGHDLVVVHADGLWGHPSTSFCIYVYFTNFGEKMQ